MTIYHRHHVVPRHAGGTDDPLNIIVCTIEEHAEHHRYRYEMTGDEYDRIAWQSLLGMISKQEAIHQVQIETGRRSGRAQLGRRKQSEETRRKISKSMSHQTRRPPSKETRCKIAEALRGKPRSDDTRRKISEANRGKKLSDETRRKLSKINTGRVFTIEHRLKISEANRKRGVVARQRVER